MNRCRTQSVSFVPGRGGVARLLPGTDLIGGIKRICRDHGIVNGTIVSAIGSLEHATIIYVVPAEGTKMNAAYVKPTLIEGPLELLSAQGTIGHNSEHQQCIHLHGSISDPNMKVFGGHFVENGNPVLATVEILILESVRADVVREWNEETGFELFEFFEQKKL